MTTEERTSHSQSTWDSSVHLGVHNARKPRSLPVTLGKWKRATDQENLDLLPFLFRLAGSPVRPLQHLSASGWPRVGTRPAELRQAGLATFANTSSAMTVLSRIFYRPTSEGALHPHGLGESELDDLLHRHVRRENADNGPLFPEDERSSISFVDSKGESPMLADGGWRGKLRETSLVHLAYEAPALRSLVNEQGATMHAYSMNSSSDEPVAHHAEVENARPEVEAALCKMSLECYRVACAQVEGERSIPPSVEVPRHARRDVGIATQQDDCRDSEDDSDRDEERNRTKETTQESREEREAIRSGWTQTRPFIRSCCLAPVLTVERVQRPSPERLEGFWGAF